jgi:hypothetical protein
VGNQITHLGVDQGWSNPKAQCRFMVIKVHVDQITKDNFNKTFVLYMKKLKLHI